MFDHMTNSYRKVCLFGQFIKTCQSTHSSISGVETVFTKILVALYFTVRELTCTYSVLIMYLSKKVLVT